MISADLGVVTPLELMLFDGATTKGVRAIVRKTGGAYVTSFNLVHVGEGLYTANWTPAEIGYFHANYIVYTDGTYLTEDFVYTRMSEVYKVGPLTTPETIANSVWDECICDHLLPGSFGEAIQLILNGLSATSVADAVWDVLLSAHTAPGTFGNLVQATWQYAREITDEVKNPTWGLKALGELIVTESDEINGNVIANGTKLDALVPLINNTKTEIINEIEVNRNLISAMAIQNAADLTTILNAIDDTNTNIDNLEPLIASLQNNTTTRFVVPERLIKPSAGSKDYQFHLRLYDNVGNPEAPDSAPTIRIRRLDTGIDIVTGAVMTQDGAKVGAYYYTFTITTGTNEYPALVEATIVEGGVTRYVPALTEITEFESDLNAIQAAIAAVDVKVTATESNITNPLYGLAALRNGELDILSAIAGQGTTLAQIKSKTDLIPANIATTSDISDVLTALGTKPNLAAITGQLNVLAGTIMGPDGRDLTQIYDVFDLSSVVKTNDPRLNYLDAAISSRSTLTAANVWSYATRTLTDFYLNPISVKAIWDYLASQATTTGSLGKRIADMLDVTVSSRATEANVTAALAGVAQQTTLLSTTTDILNNLADCISKLNNITTKVLLVKAKTDNLPSDPARQSTLEGFAIQTSDNFDDVDLRISQIKAKTDLIPVDPARQSTLLTIPTNPLLTTDARLTNLDAKISTRSTLSTADLAGLAKTTDVTSAQSAIIANNNSQTSVINAVGTNVAHIKTDTDRIPLDPATLTAISNAETAILDAIALISSGGGADAADIWSYAHRTLTQDPSTFGPDISNLATKTDVLNAKVHQYINKMTTVFNPGSGIQEVLAWAEVDGVRKASTSNCNVIVKDSVGTVKWSQSSSTPNADGVYRFVNPIVISSDANYYIIMSIVVDGSPRVTQQAFITVG